MKFKPEEIEIPCEAMTKEELEDRLVEEADPFFYSILDDEGYIREFGYVMGTRVTHALRMDDEFNGPFFDVGYHGIYEDGIISYYVPGHEEGNPSEEKAIKEEFLEFFHRELKRSYSLSSSTYDHERAVEEAWRKIKRDKDVRAIRNFQILLVTTIVVILYLVFYKGK